MTRKAVLWPEYLLRGLSRKRGRRLPLRLSADSVTPEKIVRACEKIGLNCVIEEGKRYPRAGERSLGFRVIIELPDEAKTGKNELIKKLGEALMKIKG